MPRTPNKTKKHDFFKSFMDMREHFDDFFGDFYDKFLELPSDFRSAVQTDFIRTDVNLSETDDCYKINMELSGVDKEDIDIEYEDGVLHVSAEKKEESEEKDENFYKKECSYGNVYRSFSLPDGIKEDSIKADYKNGVLKVCAMKDGTRVRKKKKISVE